MVEEFLSVGGDDTATVKPVEKPVKEKKAPVAKTSDTGPVVIEG